MRPNSIIQFERLYLGAMAIGIFSSILSWDTTMATLNADPNTAALGSSFAYIIMAFGFGISLLLWFLTARKAVTFTKWVITIFFVIGLIGLPFSIDTITALPPLNMAISIISTIMQGIAVYMLFRPDAKAWFNKEKTDVDDVGNIFD